MFGTLLSESVSLAKFANAETFLDKLSSIFQPAPDRADTEVEAEEERRGRGRGTNMLSLAATLTTPPYFSREDKSHYHQVTQTHIKMCTARKEKSKS